MGTSGLLPSSPFLLLDGSIVLTKPLWQGMDFCYFYLAASRFSSWSQLHIPSIVLVSGLQQVAKVFLVHTFAFHRRSFRAHWHPGIHRQVFPFAKPPEHHELANLYPNRRYNPFLRYASQSVEAERFNFCPQGPCFTLSLIHI